MMYIKNSWYVAANPDELDNGNIVGRTILGMPMAIYRLENGTVIVAEDRCPHRFVPLTLGKVIGDQFQCGYHGAQFDDAGDCTHVPGQEQVPKNCSLETFPVRERFGFIWVWPGDPALADDDLLPASFAVGENPEFVGGNGLFESLSAHYALIADNLFDLTHADFVHPGTFEGTGISHTYRNMKPGKDYIDKQMTYEIRDREVIARALSSNQGDDAMPFSRVMLAMGLGQDSFDGRLDSITDIHWTAPSFIQLNGEFWPSDNPEQRVIGTNLHAVTPETEFTSHYFYRAMRNFAKDPAATPAYLQAVADVFEEDRSIFEKQQERIGVTDMFDQPHASFSGDIVQYKVRAILKRLEDEEAVAAE